MGERMRELREKTVSREGREESGGERGERIRGQRENGLVEKGERRVGAERIK